MDFQNAKVNNGSHFFFYALSDKLFEKKDVGRFLPPKDGQILQKDEKECAKLQIIGIPVFYFSLHDTNSSIGEDFSGLENC